MCLPFDEGSDFEDSWQEGASAKWNSDGPGAFLVFQRDNRSAVAAECGYFLEIAVGLRQGHHRAVAVHGVAAGGEVPASALGMLLHVTGRAPVGLRGLGNRHRERRTKQQG